MLILSLKPGNKIPVSQEPVGMVTSLHPTPPTLGKNNFTGGRSPVLLPEGHVPLPPPVFCYDTWRRAALLSLPGCCPGSRVSQSSWAPALPMPCKGHRSAWPSHKPLRQVYPALPGEFGWNAWSSGRKVSLTWCFPETGCEIYCYSLSCGLFRFIHSQHRDLNNVKLMFKHHQSLTNIRIFLWYCHLEKKKLAHNCTPDES